jgi:hypothetical protein
LEVVEVLLRHLTLVLEMLAQLHLTQAEAAVEVQEVLVLLAALQTVETVV